MRSALCIFHEIHPDSCANRKMRSAFAFAHKQNTVLRANRILPSNFATSHAFLLLHMCIQSSVVLLPHVLMDDTRQSLDGKLSVPTVELQITLILGMLRDYFYSWRPYKVILARLQEIHGIRRRCKHTSPI